MKNHYFTKGMEFHDVVDKIMHFMKELFDM